MQRVLPLLVGGLLSPLWATSLNLDPIQADLYHTFCDTSDQITCQTNSYIHLDQHFLLDEDRVVLFFQLISPDAPAYPESNAYSSIIIDKDGHWEHAQNLTGSIEEIKRDPQGGLWLSHPWIWEGSSPQLSYSSDGKTWDPISFPSRRPFSPRESLTTCLLENSMLFRFEPQDDNPPTYWKVSYAKAISDRPQWHPISENTYYQYRCLEVGPRNNRWRVLSKTEEEFTLYHPKSDIELNVPRKLPITPANYSIQLGYFKNANNIPSLIQELSPLLSMTPYNLTLPNGAHKLLVGKFITPQEASQYLKSLQSQHPNNPYLQEAFITEISPQEHP